MPFLSSKLPEYSGAYEVGTIDVEVPCEKRRIGDVVHRETGDAAFELETVLFSLYYPAVKGWPGSKPHHPWVPNIAQHAEGYARFANINNAFTNTVFGWALWTLVGSTTIPAHTDVPIHGTKKTYQDYEAEQPLEENTLSQFPLIVFSHGMASSRTSYTQYYGELASRGFVIAAVEHRDGSGPGSEILYPDGTSQLVFHINRNNLEPQPSEEDLKTLQRNFRQAEIEETVRVIKQINGGRGSAILQANTRGEGSDLNEWKNRLDMNRIVVGGHSYGATTALQTLKGAPSDALPFVGAIVLDPGKQSGPLNDDIEVPVLIVHSQSWSARHSIFQGRPHFDVVKDLVKKVLKPGHGKRSHNAWFFTAKGTTHPSVTDAPLIEPFLLSWTTGSTIDAREGVLQYVKISDEFMRYLEDGKSTGVLAEDVSHPEYDHDVRTPERKEAMSREIEKYWQIHVSPGNV